MNKRRILSLMLFINCFSINTSFGMLQRYLTNNVLRKEVVNKFDFSRAAQSSEVLKVLIAYNSELRNKLCMRFLLVSPIVPFSGIVFLDAAPTSIDPIAALLCIGSAAYLVKTGNSIYLRQWMTHNLRQVQNNTSNAFHKSYIEGIIRGDIEKNLTKTRIIPTEAKETTMEYCPQTSYWNSVTDLTFTSERMTWDINNEKVLGKTLRGVVNSSDYTLRQSKPLDCK
jgi:hypothetical protein